MGFFLYLPLINLINLMKAKILSLTAATLLLVSCSTKKTIANTDTESPVKTVKTAELTPELTEGKNLYENSCARCHKLYEPKKYSQEEWKPILVRMQKKAKVDDIQIASIANYIHSQL